MSLGAYFITVQSLGPVATVLLRYRCAKKSLEEEKKKKKKKEKTRRLKNIYDCTGLLVFPEGPHHSD